MHICKKFASFETPFSLSRNRNENKVKDKLSYYKSENHITSFSAQFVINKKIVLPYSGME